MMRSRRLLPLAFGIVATAAFALPSQLPAQGSPAPRAVPPRSPDALVLAYTEDLGELAGDDHPTLKVFGDGTVVVHRPVGFKVSGEFTGKISRGELDALVEELVALGLMELDLRVLHEEKVEAERASRELFYASDPSVETIEVHLDRYRPEGEEDTLRDVSKTLRWVGLRYDQRRFPRIEGIQALAAARERLRDLQDRFLPSPRQ